MNNQNDSFFELHKQFLSHIDPETAKLPTPIVSATSEFSQTLRKALVSYHNNPQKAESFYKQALVQRNKLLNTPAVQNDEKLSHYLKQVLTENDDDIQQALADTWAKHANSYDEKTPEAQIAEAPTGFQELHDQFISYIEKDEDILQTPLQKKLQRFSSYLAYALSLHATGKINDAIQQYKECLLDRQALLKHPDISQTEKSTTYLINIMADAQPNKSSLEKALDTTYTWHKEALRAPPTPSQYTTSRQNTVEEDHSPA